MIGEKGPEDAFECLYEKIQKSEGVFRYLESLDENIKRGEEASASLERIDQERRKREEARYERLFYRETKGDEVTYDRFSEPRIQSFIANMREKEKQAEEEYGQRLIKEVLEGYRAKDEKDRWQRLRRNER